MNNIVKLSVLGTCLVAAIVGFQGTSTAAQSDSRKNYAEQLYRDFAEASGDAVTFQVRTAAAGPMSRLQGRAFAELTGEPAYRVDFVETRSIRIASPKFAAKPAVIDRTELDAGIEGFDVVGLPSRQGRYRVLQVGVNTGGVTREHRALEFCWDSQAHCVVYDPQIEFVDSVVQNYRRAKAEGYGPRIHEQLPEPSRDFSTQAVCRLASNLNIIGRSLTWAAWTQRYKNVFGVTLVTKNLGGQQVGITCNSSCNPAMYGYSNTSSASGTLGYGTDCGWLHRTGTTGRTGKANSETKCAHTFTGTAKADVTWKGTGSGISLAWDTNGGIDSNGGTLTDTCGYF